MGSGKTDFALRLAEANLLNLDLVITNIKCTHEKFQFIKRTSELVHYLNTPGEKLVILDEAGIIIDSRRSMREINVKFKSLVRLIRKLRGHLIVISQRFRDVDIAVKELISTHVLKRSKRKARFTFTIPYWKAPVDLVNIRPTRIMYDTYDTAELSFDHMDYNEQRSKKLQKDYKTDPRANEVLDLAKKYGPKYSKIAKELGMGDLRAKRILIAHGILKKRK